MDQAEPVIVQRERAVTIMTLSSPGKLNAFTLAMRDRLVAVLTACNGDPECRAIVLTGADGNMSSGGDVGSFVEHSVSAGRARLKAGSATLMRAMIGGSKPIVAAVEGYAYTFGAAREAGGKRL